MVSGQVDLIVSKAAPPCTMGKPGSRLAEKLEEDNTYEHSTISSSYQTKTLSGH